eukprot:6463166-Amphidinium_carterae.1
MGWSNKSNRASKYMSWTSDDKVRLLMTCATFALRNALVACFGSQLTSFESTKNRVPLQTESLRCCLGEAYMLILKRHP